MSLAFHSLHDSSLLRVQCVCCTPDHRGCGEVEHAPATMLVLPLRGVFVKHHEHGAQVIGDAGQALFFNRGEEYRISHPAGGNDDCLVIEPTAAVLREMLECAGAGGREAFQRTHAVLPLDLVLRRRLLWTALRRRDVNTTRPHQNTLEIQSRSLELISAAMQTTPPAQQRTRDHGRTSHRRREQVQASAVSLAAQPELDWSLDRLARHVHCSPFHLARNFRRELGDSVHQFLLRARLVRALDLVLDSNLSLTDIALQLGFATPSHFAAAFRRAYGRAPSALRREFTVASARELRKILTVAIAPTH
jgi:AraC family transcriptional regulator